MLLLHIHTYTLFCVDVIYIYMYISVLMYAVPLALKAELEALDSAFVTACMAQDSEAMASFFAEDACLMPPDHHIVRGKQGQQLVKR